MNTGEAPGAKALSKEAAVGFEPTNNGFAIRPLRPLGYAAAPGPRGRVGDHGRKTPGCPPGLRFRGGICRRTAFRRPQYLTRPPRPGNRSANLSESKENQIEVAQVYDARPVRIACGARRDRLAKVEQHLIEIAQVHSA